MSDNVMLCLDKAQGVLAAITFKLERVRTALRANRKDVAKRLLDEVLKELK